MPELEHAHETPPAPPARRTPAAHETDAMLAVEQRSLWWAAVARVAAVAEGRYSLPLLHAAELVRLAQVRAPGACS